MKTRKGHDHQNQRSLIDGYLQALSIETGLLSNVKLNQRRIQNINQNHTTLIHDYQYNGDRERSKLKCSGNILHVYNMLLQYPYCISTYIYDRNDIIGVYIERYVPSAMYNLWSCVLYVILCNTIDQSKNLIRQVSHFQAYHMEVVDYL